VKLGEFVEHGKANKAQLVSPPTFAGVGRNLKKCMKNGLTFFASIRCLW
jgi:hypothetical protein